MRRAVIIAALATPLLAACGSSSTSTSPGSPSSSATPSSAAPVPTTTAPAVAGGHACTWTATGDAAKPAALPPASVGTQDHTATLKTTAGTVTIHLTGSATPCTVASFISLAKQGFYNGTHCHRLGDTTGFEFLQCGDPTGTGSGGPGYSFADELTGKETYPAGTVAMANSGPDTDGSQFFLVFGDSSFGPNYTVFGHMDAASISVLKAVGAKGNDGSGGDGSGQPTKPVVFTSITIN